jgi:Adenylate kinase and related kinases
MDKYLKVMFGNKGANYEYRIGEINIAKDWNPNAKTGRDFGGFNFSVDDKIIRWLARGDTLYDIVIPEDADVINVEESATPNGVFRSNKIIPINPRKITDEMAMNFYKKSTIPDVAYYKALGGCAVMGYDKTAKQMFRDKVSYLNIDMVLDEWNDFIHRNDRYKCNDTVIFIDEALKEIKSNLLISINVDKEPYIKQITDDNIINITGESGSGKSTYVNKFLKNYNYIVIDTDDLKWNNSTDNKNSLELRKILIDKYGNNIFDLFTDFNIIYKEILDYYKDSNKTLVIDSAQYRNLRKEDIDLLKGKIIIMRTCIDVCYERCVNRWKIKTKNYTEEDLNRYENKKLKMYEWYKSLNIFIEDIDKL